MTDTLPPNPKDVIGATKPDLSLNPPSASAHQARAQMDGAKKYGPYNWRDQPVQAMTYLAAAKRHIDQLIDGQDVDPKSGVHHAGHAMASLAIFLDAQECGKLIDNRPPAGAASAVIDRLTLSVDPLSPASAPFPVANAAVPRENARRLVAGAEDVPPLAQGSTAYVFFRGVECTLRRTPVGYSACQRGRCEWHEGHATAIDALMACTT